MLERLSWDRMKGPLVALMRAAFPRIDYAAFYRAKVLSQSSDKLTVDVQPDADPTTGEQRLPGLQQVPLKWGIPGMTAQLNLAGGALYVMIGWEAGDPQRPYAMVVESGAAVTQLVLKAQTVYVADSAGTHPAGLGDNIETRLHQLETAFNGAIAHTHPQAGGGTTSASANFGTSITNTPTVQASQTQVK